MAIDRDGLGHFELAGATAFATPRFDQFAVNAEACNAVRRLIHDVHIAGAVRGDTAWRDEEIRLALWPAAVAASAPHGALLANRRQFAHHGQAAIGNVHVSGGIDCHTDGSVHAWIVGHQWKGSDLMAIRVVLDNAVTGRVSHIQVA